MGHAVEYFIDLPAKRARDWLSILPGDWYGPELWEGLVHGRLQWGEQTLHVYISPKACQISVPCIKYSWLIAMHDPSLAWVAQFENWLEETLPGERAVRVDELLWLEWEAEAGRSWDEIPDPVDDLRNWLLSYEFGLPLDSGQSYFRLLPE